MMCRSQSRAVWSGSTSSHSISHSSRVAQAERTSSPRSPRAQTPSRAEPVAIRAVEVGNSNHVAGSAFGDPGGQDVGPVDSGFRVKSERAGSSEAWSGRHLEIAKQDSTTESQQEQEADGGASCVCVNLGGEDHDSGGTSSSITREDDQTNPAPSRRKDSRQDSLVQQQPVSGEQIDGSRGGDVQVERWPRPGAGGAPVKRSASTRVAWKDTVGQSRQGETVAEDLINDLVEQVIPVLDSIIGGTCHPPMRIVVGSEGKGGRKSVVVGLLLALVHRGPLSLKSDAICHFVRFRNHPKRCWGGAHAYSKNVR